VSTGCEPCVVAHPSNKALITIKMALWVQDRLQRTFLSLSISRSSFTFLYAPRLSSLAQHDELDPIAGAVAEDLGCRSERREVLVLVAAG